MRLRTWVRFPPSPSVSAGSNPGPPRGAGVRIGARNVACGPGTGPHATVSAPVAPRSPDRAVRVRGERPVALKHSGAMADPTPRAAHGASHLTGVRRTLTQLLRVLLWLMVAGVVVQVFLA